MSNPPAPAPHLALSIAGNRVGDLRAVAGLELEADVVSNDLGPGNQPKKHVARIGWTPAQLTLGLGMGEAMARWLNGALAGRATSVSGTIEIADANAHAQWDMTFADAFATRFSTPSLKIGSLDPAALLIEFEAASVRLAKGDGHDIRGKAPAAVTWLCSGFNLEIGSLPCAGVIAVAPLTWTAKLAESQGPRAGSPRHPVTTVLSDLQITIPVSDFPAWAAAAKSWFIDGAHLEGNEMAGRLTFVDGALAKLASVSLVNVGFRRFPMIASAGAAAESFNVTLYVEAISFELGAISPKPPVSPA